MTTENETRAMLESLAAPTSPQTFALSTPVRLKETGEPGAEGSTNLIESLTVQPLTWADLRALPFSFEGLNTDSILQLLALSSGQSAQMLDELDLDDLAPMQTHIAHNLAPCMLVNHKEELLTRKPPKCTTTIQLSTTGINWQDGPLKSVDFEPLKTGHIRGIGLAIQQLTWAEARVVASRATGLPEGILGKLNLIDTAAIAEVVLLFLLKLRGTSS